MGDTPLPPAEDDDIIDSLPETAKWLGLSYSTLRRILAAGKGPRVVQLSARRLGMRRRNRREWVAGNTSG
jgi:predicted DNA-binding transcriptional regulator AlpA